MQVQKGKDIYIYIFFFHIYLFTTLTLMAWTFKHPLQTHSRAVPLMRIFCSLPFLWPFFAINSCKTRGLMFPSNVVNQVGVLSALSGVCLRRWQMSVARPTADSQPGAAILSSAPQPAYTITSASVAPGGLQQPVYSGTWDTQTPFSLVQTGLRRILHL